MNTLWEKAIRFRHPDYDPDRAQKLISSSMSRHLSTHNISSKFINAFLSNLAHRQTDRQTNAARGRKHVPPPLSDVKKRCVLKSETVQWSVKAQYMRYNIVYTAYDVDRSADTQMTWSWRRSLRSSTVCATFTATMFCWLMSLRPRGISAHLYTFVIYTVSPKK